MKVIIVDDQYEKVKVYVKTLKSLGVKDIHHVSSSFDALKEMKNNKYDLMILDLKIPDRLGDEINPRGGIDVLEHIEIHDDFFMPTYVIGATSHQDSYDKYKTFFDKKGWNLILGVENEEKIQDLIKSRINYSKGSSLNFDVAILTALSHTEFEAVLNLPIEWSKVAFPDDCNIYYKGLIDTKDKADVTIIATSCLRMGIASSASVATKMLLKFNPKFIIMTGIAAGIKNKTNIGDILIADPCWDWGSGKLTVKDGVPTLLSSPHQIALRPDLRAKFKEISAQKLYITEIYQTWIRSNGQKPQHLPNVIIGPIATGSVVLEDPKTVNMILSQHRETIGIEMEAYGVMASAEYSHASKKCEPIIIKSVCDFADLEKNDDWQKYAAFTSTNFAFEFIKNNLF